MRSSIAVLLSAVLLAAVLPSSASAQSSPFAPPAPLVPPEQQAPEPVNAADPDSEGLKSWQQTLIIASGFVLLFGVGVAIVMDARRRRPITEEDLHPVRAAGHDAAHRRIEHQKRKSKQRTQRAARKKNRQNKK